MLAHNRRGLVGLLLIGVVVLAGGLATLALRAVTEPDPGLASLHLEPARVSGCMPVEASVALGQPAPAGGLVVDLATTAVAASVPDQVRVDAGATEQSFTVPTEPVAVSERAEVRASLEGTTVRAPVEIVPVEAAVLGNEPDVACQTGFEQLHGYDEPERAGAFDAAAIPEASGLAASRRNPGWLYIVDDEQPSEIWVMRPDGSDLTPIALEGFVGVDTEALAVGPCGADEPDPCVYVGDIGDNFHRYDHVSILRFAEPDLSDPPAAVRPERIAVRYPDGPVDAEALLVDDDATVYIVTKQAGPDGAGAARLFASTDFVDGTLDDLGAVGVPAPDQPLVADLLGLGVVVTGGDYQDGRVVLRTYDHVVEYVAPAVDAPVAEFASWPAREVPAARELQSEAVAFAVDDCGYYTVSEQVGDIWWVACRD